ncbi:MAG: isochorismatase family protein [Deltaproteobacteria bacterium]|nr:isochorismatase family protein [Deltaproteobacteria bacterium]
MDAITLAAGQTALLVVDVQERLVAAMPSALATRMLASCELLVETASRFALPLFVTEHYPQGLGPTHPSLRLRLEATQPRPRVVEKTIFSAMGPPEIPRALAQSSVRSVIVVGMEAHVCVFQTARELVRRGYSAHVPFDAVASRDPDCRRVALELLGRHGVQVTTTETCVFDLLGDAKNVHFKALSRMVKELPMG